MIKVFLADDHGIVRDGLKHLIESESVMRVVGTAGDTSSTIDGVRTLEPEVLVLDIKMPGRGPVEVVEEVRRLAPATRILILTANPVDHLAIRLLKAGASGYLGKSVLSEELLAAIRKVANGGRYITEEMAEKLVLSLSEGVDRAAHELLSQRELAVLTLLGDGLTMTEIARQLALSIKTVSTYRARVLVKLGLETTHDLIAYAFKHGIGGADRKLGD